MSFEGDPYRTLGVAPDATLNEVRSAYRRLVKQWHPDAAGERALPRFLAIQAAYERLVDGEGRLRPPAARPPGRAGGARPASGPRADPARARASRDAWRARRTGAAPGGQTSAGAAGPAGGPGEANRRGTGERKGHHRTTRKATPGSTTYDEAAEPLDPRWGGATWYGATSGTYWTINPREYADPRKHGPEYLARARRAAGAPGGTEAGETDAPGGAWGWSEPGRTRTQGDPHEWRAGGWSFEATGGDPGRAPRPGRDRSAVPPASPASPVMDLEAVVRRAFPEHLRRLIARGPAWRLLVVLVAWPPLGYAGAAAVDAVTGCGAFSAACPEPFDLASIAVQPPLLVALALVPALAAAAAFASLAAFAAAFPAALVASLLIPLSPDLARLLVAALVVAAWSAAFAGPELLRRRAGGRRPDGEGPVP